MNATRRRLIRSAGLAAVAGLAGCTNPSGDDGNETDDGTDNGSDLPGDNGSDLPGDNGSDAGGTRPEGTGGPGISIRSVDDDPGLPVVPSVEITEDTATDDHPPQLRVTVTNEGDETVRVGEGREICFQYVSDTGGNLTLLPTGQEYPAEAGCWRLKEEIATTQEYRVTELEPGDSTEALVDLYALPGEDACLPVGEYRFEATYSVSRGDGTLPSDGEHATWGFAVSLE